MFIDTPADLDKPLACDSPRKYPSAVRDVKIVAKTPEESEMKFGMFVIGDFHWEANQTLRNYYDHVWEQVRWGEELGYESFWFGEHHFDFCGVVPPPPVLMSVAAAQTSRIRIGVAVALLPRTS